MGYPKNWNQGLSFLWIVKKSTMKKKQQTGLIYHTTNAEGMRCMLTVKSVSMRGVKSEEVRWSKFRRF
jgi:hypothetical protein